MEERVFPLAGSAGLRDSAHPFPYLALLVAAKPDENDEQSPGQEVGEADPRYRKACRDASWRSR